MQSKWLPATMPGDVFKGNAGVGLGTDLCGAMDRRSRRQCRQKTEPPCTRSVRTSGVGGQPRLITSRGHLPDCFGDASRETGTVRMGISIWPTKLKMISTVCLRWPLDLSASWTMIFLMNSFTMAVISSGMSTYFSTNAAKRS